MWQPIQTAPKDGTEVIVADPENGMVTSAYWYARNDRVAPDDGWWDNLPDRGAYTAHICFEPTCWMPLPEPCP